MSRDGEPEERAEPAQPAQESTAASEGSLEGEPPVADGPGAEEGRTNRVLKFARRLMDRRELAEDTKELLHAVLNTSDKAKTEAVRLMAREFRSYLKELRLKEDLIKLATSHSLEISISLKPLPGADDEEGK